MSSFAGIVFSPDFLPLVHAFMQKWGTLQKTDPTHFSQMLCWERKDKNLISSIKPMICKDLNQSKLLASVPPILLRPYQTLIAGTHKETKLTACAFIVKVDSDTLPLCLKALLIFLKQQELLFTGAKPQHGSGVCWFFNKQPYWATIIPDSAHDEDIQQAKANNRAQQELVWANEGATFYFWAPETKITRDLQTFFYSLLARIQAIPEHRHFAKKTWHQWMHAIKRESGGNHYQFKKSS